MTFPPSIRKILKIMSIPRYYMEGTENLSHPHRWQWDRPCIVILGPMPMYGFSYILSKQCTSTILGTGVVLTGWIAVELLGFGLLRCGLLCSRFGSHGLTYSVVEVVDWTGQDVCVDSVTRDLHGKVHEIEKKDVDTKIEEDQFKNL